MALDLSEVSQRLPEGLSVRGVAVHDLDRTSGDAEAHGRERQALELEVAHHAEAGVALLADQVLGRHPHVVEEELARG